ncbi:MAG: histidine phosphatase family protein [Aestuariivita sp.]|nr:histidine phosphatase family protein [Aestuariivita sp.]
MTHWYWVRHGPTHQKNLTGWHDIPADLSDKNQIHRLNHYLPQSANIVASDLRRASTTADLLSKNRHRLPDNAGLREFNFGDWDGQDFLTISRTFPYESRAFWEEPGDIAPPKGESWNTAVQRINAAVNELIDSNKKENIIIVAHFGVILTQIQRALNVQPSEALKQKIDNFSITKLSHNNSNWNLKFLNFVP